MNSYIFDFNGTMVFDSRFHERAWRYYVQELIGREISREEFRLHVHGKTSAMILKYFLGDEKLTKDKIVSYSLEKEAYYRQLCKSNLDQFGLVDGLENFLDEAKKKQIAMTIATAANYDNVIFYFEHFALDRWFRFEDVVYDDATLIGKPDPDIYLRAIRNLATNPKDCVVFEDAVSGVESAYAAGVGEIIGVSGDSDAHLLYKTGKVDRCIKDFTDAHICEKR